MRIEGQRNKQNFGFHNNCSGKKLLPGKTRSGRLLRMLKILVTGGCKFENCDLVIKRENEFQKRVGKFIVPIPEPLMVDSLAQVEMR